MQVLGAAGFEILHQGHADTLRHATLDLTFHQQRIDRLADIMSRVQMIQPDRAKPGIDGQFHHLRTIPEHGVRRALSVFIQWRGGRIIGFFGPEYIAFRCRACKCSQVDAALAVAVADDQAPCSIDR